LDSRKTKKLKKLKTKTAEFSINNKWLSNCFKKNQNNNSILIEKSKKNSQNKHLVSSL
jgi:hypothetical protein